MQKKSKPNETQKAIKTPLQNFTLNSELEIQSKTEQNKVNPDLLSKEDKEILRTKYTRLLSTKGVEHDYIFNQINHFLTDDEISYVKERNLLLIHDEINKYIKMNQHGMPTVTKLAILTGLSRVTITKYLKEIFNSELETHKKILHKNMFDVILTNVAKKAMSGDLPSAKLYMDTMIKLDEKESITMYIKNQQNNIVVNPEK